MPKCIHAAERRQRQGIAKRLEELAAIQAKLFDDTVRRAREASRLAWPPIADPWDALSASSPACETGPFRAKVTASSNNAATIGPGNAAWARMRAELLALWQRYERAR